MEMTVYKYNYDKVMIVLPHLCVYWFVICKAFIDLCYCRDGVGESDSQCSSHVVLRM